MIDYGNTTWHVYVVAAYLVTFLILVGYAAFHLRQRLRLLQQLQDEGFLNDEEEALGENVREDTPSSQKN